MTQAPPGQSPRGCVATATSHMQVPPPQLGPSSGCTGSDLGWPLVGLTVLAVKGALASRQWVAPTCCTSSGLGWSLMELTILATPKGKGALASRRGAAGEAGQVPAAGDGDRCPPLAFTAAHATAPQLHQPHSPTSGRGRYSCEAVRQAGPGLPVGWGLSLATNVETLKRATDAREAWSVRPGPVWSVSSRPPGELNQFHKPCKPPCSENLFRISQLPTFACGCSPRLHVCARMNQKWGVCKIVRIRPNTGIVWRSRKAGK